MPFWIALSMGSRYRYYGLRSTCALGIVFSYSSAYVLISWCLATGVLHAISDTAQTPHHHDGAYAHDHHHDASFEPSWPDICDLALQILLVSACLPSPNAIAVGSPGETIFRWDDDENRSQVPIDRTPISAAG